MILTRTYLNARRHGAQRLLGSPQSMHAAILSGFPPGHDPGRTLWRVDRDDPLRPTLFVVSASRPDFAHLEEQAGWPSQPTTQSADYGTILNSLEEGQRWGFRLKVNPTHRALVNGDSKVLAHVTVAQQTKWLLERQERLGITLGDEGDSTFQLVAREVTRFKRSGATVTLGTATFAGVLRVEDPTKLRAAMTEGVGRAKAYGCGLLTLAKP